MTRMVSVQGGYSGASQAVVSKELPCDGRLVSFVKINKSSLWLLKLCGGKADRKGLLRKTSCHRTTTVSMWKQRPSNGNGRCTNEVRSCGHRRSDAAVGTHRGHDGTTIATQETDAERVHRCCSTCEHCRDMWYGAVADRACIAQP